MQKLKLNIGCGLTAPSGWLNIDCSLNARLAKWPWLRRMLKAFKIIPLAKADIPWPRDIYVYDVRKGLLFPDNSVEAIYCSHFLEHLTRFDAFSFMNECYRVLIPGGIMRIIVPDLRASIEEYMKRISASDKEALIKELPSERFLESLCILNKESSDENIFTRLYKKITYDKNIHKWMYDEYSLTAIMLEHGFGNVQCRKCYESLIKDIEKLDPERFENIICLEAEKLG